MTTEVVNIIEESRTRYLTYALSVVTSRAIPDVRDGLKPVQRRIIYAMLENLGLTPNKNFRKSAAVVGEVLGRYHPHGDAACYEAMVRMAQDFSLRYPLVQGQGNFGSLDGDGAAAYRYTEAKLRELALELLGEIHSDTVAFRDNFDQTTKEPVVLPSKVPNLLMNGATGIAVGMATSIPPHNLTELLDALKLLVETPDATTKDIIKIVKAPDFPTGCEILNSKDELVQMYDSGKGTIRMRATYKIEYDKPKGARTEKKLIVFDSIPYGIDKSTIVEKIADVVIQKKLTHVEDVRDESTELVRIVLEISPDAEEDKLLAYLYKTTPLQANFSINFTVLTPGLNEMHMRPAVLGLKSMLEEFLKFRYETEKRTLSYEKNKLEERVHVLQGVAKVIDVLDKVITEVRKSSSRGDAITRLEKAFSLTQKQAEFLVDLRIYQLTKTNLEEVLSELTVKEKRIAQINKILSSDKALKAEIIKDLDRLRELYGDKRKCKVLSQYEVLEVSESDLIPDEEVFVILTKDGWLKRIKSTNDPSVTRLREGDSILFSSVSSTKDNILFFTNYGMAFSTEIYNLSATSGFGEPIQKLFKFKDGEQVTYTKVIKSGSKESESDIVILTQHGLGYRTKLEDALSSKKNGKKIIKLKDGDSLSSVINYSEGLVMLFTLNSYVLQIHSSEIPPLGVGSKGVQLIKVSKDDQLVTGMFVPKNKQLTVTHSKGECVILSSSFSIGKRAQKGEKIPQKKIGLIEKIS